MEYAITEFFQAGDEMRIGMRTGITRLFKGTVGDPEWHCKNFFRQLIAINPFQVSSVTHAPFWDPLKVYIERAIKSYEEDNSEPVVGEFVIILNRGEMVYKLRHHEALLAILCAIMSTALGETIQSVYNIPEHILVAFLKRKELRTMFYDRFANRCEDRLDIYSLHDRGLITDVVLFDTLDEQADLKAQDCFVTPPPELDESAVPDPAKPSDIDATKLIFPDRPVLPEFRGVSVVVIQHTLAFYSYLWSAASKAVESVRYQCKVAHGSECKCAEKILNMRVLLPLLRAYVEQSIDLKTVVRADVRHFFSVSTPLLEVIEPLAANISSYLSGASTTTPELDTFLHSHTTIAEMMESDIGKMYKGGKHSVFTCRLSEVPLKLLLRELDSEFLFARSLPLLRGFLANRDRENYVVYLMPKEVGYFDLRVTLALVFDKFGSTFRNLRNILPLQAISGVYVVCKPGDMTTFRCLMLSERIFENAVNNTVNVPSTLDLPQACVLLRNYLMRANEMSLEVQRAAALSLARMMDLYINNDPRNCGQLFPDGNPQNREIIDLFRYIPKVCHILESHFETTEERLAILKSFLRQHSLHTCNRMILSNFLYKLERRLDDESPYRKIVDKIKKAYKSKLGDVEIKAGKCKDFDVQISRRKDFDLGHTMLYKLLLDTDVFVADEIAEYLQALVLKKSTSITKYIPRNTVLLSKEYVKKYKTLQESGDDPSTLYGDNICRYWNQASFFTRTYERQELVELATCASRDSADQLLQRADLELHYEASLFGHTFRPVRPDDTDMPQPTADEIRSLVGLMSFLEFRYHGDEVEPSQDHTIFNIIYSERPCCMPIVAEPSIHFENSFFVYVGAEWPLPVDSSFDVISDGGDLAISQKRNIMDHVAEHCQSWRPSNRVTNSSGVNATYSACLVAAQKAFV